MTKIDEDLLQILFDYCDISFNRFGDVEADFYNFDNYNDFVEYYGGISGVGARTFENTKAYLIELIKSAEYYEDEQIYLQLHDNPTMYNIHNENFSDTDWGYLLDDCIKEFESQTGVDVYALGRSGRHICVDFTLDNLERYDELVSKALDIEKWFIKQANDISIYD